MIRAAVQDLSYNPTAFNDPTSPESRAVQWLATQEEGTGWDPVRLSQRYALLTLDFAAHTGRRRQLQATFATAGADECTWEGVTCATNTSIVTKVVWAEQDLTGHISPEVGLLKNLTYLDLAENALTGPIPESLYDLIHLEYLYLHDNQLTGTISESIANLYSLINLYLNHNQLSGSFPVGLGSVSRGSRRPLSTLLLLF